MGLASLSLSLSLSSSLLCYGEAKKVERERKLM
jgi:hypothetical protein